MRMGVMREVRDKKRDSHFWRKQHCQSKVHNSLHITMWDYSAQGEIRIKIDARTTHG